MNILWEYCLCDLDCFQLFLINQKFEKWPFLWLKKYFQYNVFFNCIKLNSTITTITDWCWGKIKYIISITICYWYWIGHPTIITKKIVTNDAWSCTTSCTWINSTIPTSKWRIALSLWYNRTCKHCSSCTRKAIPSWWCKRTCLITSIISTWIISISCTICY